ncbi:rhodanese-like domain-containing protein [Bacillus sp. FSL K6-3431]|uniref:rhodanese-like domain-containing protein n=1 Tax=Bacillus sp. FSL K6-3431 TaxID=2921500 RepID=UPI0030F8B41E
MVFITDVLFAVILFLLIKRFLPVKGVRNITIQDLKIKLKDNNNQFIDVRTLGEFNQYHIPHFKNIPLHELSRQVSQLSKDEYVIVICQSGMRSLKAGKILKKQGFSKILNVKGGVSAWR